MHLFQWVTNESATLNFRILIDLLDYNMKITIKELRKLISEEVDRLVRNSAGFGGTTGIGGRCRGSIEVSPIGLGNDNRSDEELNGQEQEIEDDEECFRSRIARRGCGLD